LSNDWQRPTPAETSEPVNKAREAAEALFRPKQQLAVDPSSGPASASDIQRKPRIIPLEAPEPHREAIVKPSTPPRKIASGIHKIPTSEYGRVRALAGHGMTIEQVAALYGVLATIIERIVATTSDANVTSPQIGRDPNPGGQGDRGAR
jgi:hypothetical protein